mmetsp:Transcript_47249/g.150453  ORF Transcript_47249/g.150453 Transcript_47249/m.150453 type:complete len:255 (-) Transcript_47249:388-1152(-)
MLPNARGNNNGDPDLPIDRPLQDGARPFSTFTKHSWANLDLGREAVERKGDRSTKWRSYCSTCCGSVHHWARRMFNSSGASSCNKCPWRGNSTNAHANNSAKRLPLSGFTNQSQPLATTTQRLTERSCPTSRSDSECRSTATTKDTSPRRRRNHSAAETQTDSWDLGEEALANISAARSQASTGMRQAGGPHNSQASFRSEDALSKRQRVRAHNVSQSKPPIQNGKGRLPCLNPWYVFIKTREPTSAGRRAAIF